MRAAAPSAALVALVTKMRRAGESYSAIGASCGLTKGAVAGLLWRAGKCERSPDRRGPIKRKRNPEAAKPKPVAPPPPALLPPPPVVALQPGALRPGLACTWPLWTDATPRSQRTYCGEPVFGGSYCAAHVALARRRAA